MYNVVFEYTTAAGGYAGIRYWTSYTDKNEFIKMNPPSNDDIDSILAEGVTPDEAQNLTSLNPEICHLTAAVEEMCYADDGSIDLNLAQYHLQKAFMGIKIDRARRIANGLRPNKSFPFVEIGDEDTEKNRLYRFIKNTFINPNGSIDHLLFAEASINTEIASIILERIKRLI